ncbi:MAG TPA: DUF5320 domain-containing protein [Anaerovoracaceae bacterium]|nr:DUF5320 domain-containing protein [Anaerovoracaceae bacterium]
MPRGDGTGPFGTGMMTGRGLGPCAGTNRTGYGSGFGFGLGCRRGLGGRFGGFFGFGRGIAAEPISEKTQKELLKDQKSFFQDRLEAIEKQLDEL